MEIACSGKASEIYQKLKTKLEQYKQDGKLAQVKSIEYNDLVLEALASGTGFKARIQSKDNKVVIDLDLNFMLKPMRGQIEESIKKSISRVLA